jgi:SmpA / OmlA family
MKKKSGAILVIGLLLVLCVMVLFAAGCGKTYPYGTGGPGFTELKTPVVAPANAADLPADYNKIEVGMSTEEVKAILDFPATIQDIDGKRVYKYYVPFGEEGTDNWTVNRLYINFVDDKVESMDLSTP